jgi:hypothetical protein
MRIALIGAAAALATASVCAAAEPAAAQAGVATEKSAKAKPKTRKICRRESTTGSTIPIRICRTVAEPQEQAKAEPAPVAPVDAGSQGAAAE